MENSSNREDHHGGTENTEKDRALNAFMTLLNFSRRTFMKRGAVGGLGLFFSRASWANETPKLLRLYIGTYTSGKSEGIYIYRMDPNTGELKRFDVIKSLNPSFLAIDRRRRYLYAVNETTEFEGKSSGAVSSFAVDTTTGKLTFLNQQPSLGADPCHLTIDKGGRFLLVANYTGGSVSVFPIRRNGTLSPASDFVQHDGFSVKEQQKGPHAHCVILDASNRHALAADLGADKLIIYRFKPETGKLQTNTQPWAQLTPGAGPRHLTLDSRGKTIYVINELDSTMSVYRYNGVKGTMRPIETVSTLPEGFTGTSYCADLHLSPSGKFLYGSNRGHNSIVVFAVNENTGRLTLVEHVSTQGNWPRNFTIDPTGRFLLVANQRSDTVVIFRINPASGRLTPTGHVSEVPAPACLKFA